MHIDLWKFSAWRAIKDASRKNQIEADDPEGSIATLFYEDENGNVVSEDVKSSVRGDLRGFWIDMINDGEAPVPWNQLGFRRREQYRKLMGDKYPWLRLCEGDWKLRQIWISNYKKSKYASATKPANASKTNKTGPTTTIVISSDTDSLPVGSNVHGASSPIEILDSDPSNSPNHKASSSIEIIPNHRLPSTSKRRRDVEDDSADSEGAAKKHKGKGKEVAIPDFHPPKPSKKKPAKLGKVSSCMRSISCIFTDNTQIDPLYSLPCCHDRITRNLIIVSSAGIRVASNVLGAPPVQVRVVQGHLIN